MSADDAAGPPADRRRRPPPGRLSPAGARRRARGGAVEGLAWLGRVPEARGVDPLSARPAARSVRPLRGLPLPHRDVRARSICHPAGTSSSPPPIAAGWTRSSWSTRCRSSRAPGSSAARRRRSPALAGGAGPPSRRAPAGMARWDRRRTACRLRPGRRSRTAAVFAQMPEGTVSGPAGRIGPFRIGWAVIALRTRRPDRSVRHGRDRGALCRAADDLAVLPADVGRKHCSAAIGTASGRRRTLGLSSTSPGGSAHRSRRSWGPSSRSCTRGRSIRRIARAASGAG